MAGAENDQNQIKKNLPRLVDVFNFAGLTSATSALLVAYVKKFSTFFTFITPINLFLYFITIFDNIRWTFFLELIFLMFMSSAYYTLNLSYMFILGWILLIVGVMIFPSIGFLYVWKWRFPGSVDLGGLSVELQMMSFEFLIILFVNGYTLLFEWFIHQKARVWKVTGVGLIVLLVLSSVLGCIFRMVYRWQKYHRAGARVSFVTSTTEVEAEAAG